VVHEEKIFVVFWWFSTGTFILKKLCYWSILSKVLNMSAMRNVFIITAILIVVLIWHFFPEKHQERGKGNLVSEQKADSSSCPKVNGMARPNEASHDLVVVEPVSLDELSDISTTEETAIVFQRLSTELIQELKRLETAEDVDKIRSRLAPVVQKFYYLNEVSGITTTGPQRRLPNSFKEDIKRLEEIWTSNSDLASTADDLFSNFGLLRYEHVPYQLREELVLK